MKRILFCSFLLFGCGQTKRQDVSNITTSQLQKDSTSELENESQTITEADTSLSPTIYFLDFTSYLDSVGYIADTNRARKVSERVYDKSTIIVVGNKPFFSIIPENHEIQLRRDWVERFKWDTVTADYEILKKPRLIFVYYYRKNEQNHTIEDGVVEEWNFSSDNDAKRALNELNKIKEVVYFNTAPFAFQVNNYLYLFHTRASVFNSTLGKFYDTFKERRTSQQ